MPDDKICVARIGAPHGVRGAVKLWPFTEDPLAVEDYGPLLTKDGKRSFEIATARVAKDHLVVTFKGVDSRDAAERLNSIELYVARDQLPDTDDDEFYYADLIGLTAQTAAGDVIGRIMAVHDFGAGTIIEIAPPAGGQTLMLPFTDPVFPEIDIAGGKAIVELPGEILGDDPTAA